MSDVLRVRTEPGGEWTEIPSIQGPQGEDGFSPTVTTSAIDGGTKVTITDATGPHEFNVMNGAQGLQGIQGEKGADGAPGAKGDPGTPGAKGDPGDTYTITAADYDAIADVVLTKIPSAEGVSY